MFDRFTGRGWKPSSSLATSELIERLKKLLDAEAREEEGRRRFVPHNIKLKMQWDKFSADSDDTLKKLENELLTAAVDHINDRRYYTHAPLAIEVKPDYFTAGVKLNVSFNKPGEDEHEAEVNVTLPAANVSDLIPEAIEAAPPSEETFVARFEAAGRQQTVTIKLKPGDRLSVGRTRENGLTIDDASVSKIHASLAVNSAGELVIADTGSTNGTFINGERISYGKAVVLKPSDKPAFGAVSVDIEHIERASETAVAATLAPTEEFSAAELARTVNGETTVVLEPAAGNASDEPQQK